MLVVLVLLVAACAATTPLGKAKEGLNYDKEVNVSVMAEAVRAYDAKLITQTQYDKIKEAYTIWQRAHNLAVDAVALAEKRAASGQPWSQLEVNQARAVALNAATMLVQLLTQAGIIK
jgi:hypothetical protein